MINNGTLTILIIIFVGIFIFSKIVFNAKKGLNEYDTDDADDDMYNQGDKAESEYFKQKKRNNRHDSNNNNETSLPFVGNKEEGIDENSIKVETIQKTQVKSNSKRLKFNLRDAVIYSEIMNKKY